MVIKQGRLIVSVGQPLQFTDVLEGDMPDVKASKLQLTIGNTLKAYRETAEKLLTGKYAAQKELAPRHLREACNTLVIGCDDGVFVRYDLDTTGNPRIRCAVMKASLAEIAPQF